MYPRIKICGIRDTETAMACANLGADAIGLVFHPASPRHVTIEAARLITAELPPFVTTVGLFVDAEAHFVQEVLQQVPLDLLQFHGNESAQYCRQFGRPYIKAVQIVPALNLLDYAAQYAVDEPLQPTAAYPLARGILCDTFSKQAAGGTGQCFDWTLLPKPWQAPSGKRTLPLILSGGLQSNNVAGAIRQVQPWAVDVSSGVERERGIKDVALIRQFIDAVRSVN